MTEKTPAKPVDKHKVGDVVKVRAHGSVIRPDQTELRVIRGVFVLDAPGSYTIDGETVDVS